jgi:hypothetical protein
MEILWGTNLFVRSRDKIEGRAMAQVIELNSDSRRWTRYVKRPPVEVADDDIWPEVSTGYATQNPAPVNPQNGQGRVLSEVLLILTIAGLGAVVVTLIGAMLSS